MNISNVLSLLGGLALFLYGMQMMSSGLEAAAGNKMKTILEKLTSNRFLGVFVGAAITAIIQSSSATTVMVVGFVNSGMMTLNQAVWIIMGANIGTTVTGLLIALDMGAMALLFAFIGVAAVVFVKRPKIQHYGQILAGLGVLFIGMEMMSGAMTPLRSSETFVKLMTKFSNPIIGIAVGMIFTAIIQSSSASVGILQTLAAGGLIALPNAIYVLFGQNIGTCITAVLAAIGTGRSAKRTTIIHLLFNVIGTAIFTTVSLVFPLAELIMKLIPNDPSMQIAATHTMFNIVTTLILIPFGNGLASLTVKILPERANETSDVEQLCYIKSVDAIREHQVGNSAVAYNDVKRELERMAQMVKNNVEASFETILTKDPSGLTSVVKTEEYVDFLNKEISKFLSHYIANSPNASDSEKITSFFRITGNLERISDHAVNICEYSEMIAKKNISFSDEAQKEIEKMKNISSEAMDFIVPLEFHNIAAIGRAERLEEKIDDMTEDFRKNQLERMQKGKCSGEACVIYSEMLTDFERIGDHIRNIAESLE